MTPGARLAAAIEILDDITTRRRPAADALKDYGLSHRFAGSKDRAAISALVYDALRRRASAAYLMGADGARATLLGTLRLARGLETAQIAALCTGAAHAPATLDAAERDALDRADVADAPSHVRGDFPEWLAPALAAVFGDDLVPQMQAMAARAPLDLRVNTLKASRDKVLQALAHLHPEPTAFSPEGVRLPLGEDGRGPALAGEPAFAKGWIEVQDEGSQLAARLAAPPAGAQVLDLCAGGGGKTLALAALMANRGQIYATDADPRRLAGLYPRLERSGARNVQIRTPRRGASAVDDLDARCDVVLVDAPCTGTGTWRRNPDAKWRIRPGALDQRIAEQTEVLAQAARYVKPGGRLVYVTCSLLREENEDRLEALLAARPDFSLVPPPSMLETAGLPSLAGHLAPGAWGLRLTPLSCGTDGFFVAALIRSAEGSFST